MLEKPGRHMVPFRLNPQQFSERYAKCLERISGTAIAYLRQHFALPVQDGVDSVEVQVFVPEDDPCVASAWIYYQGKDNRVDSADLSLFAGRSLELAIGLDGLEEFDPRFYTTEKFGGRDIVANALKAWLAECWWKAGGWSYPVPTFLYAHDGVGNGKSVKLTER